MTEFEEITIKKIIKGKIVEGFYVNLNVALGKNRITNKELSEKIGWDSAGYNQKLNRQSDLRFSTFVAIIAAICELQGEVSYLQKVSSYKEYMEMDLKKLVGLEEYQLGKLFLHVTAAAEGKEDFLCTPEYREIYRSLRPYVFSKKRIPQLSEKERTAYIKYCEDLAGAGTRED